MNRLIVLFIFGLGSLHCYAETFSPDSSSIEASKSLFIEATEGNGLMAQIERKTKLRTDEFVGRFNALDKKTKGIRKPDFIDWEASKPYIAFKDALEQGSHELDLARSGTPPPISDSTQRLRESAMDPNNWKEQFKTAGERKAFKKWAIDYENVYKEQRRHHLQNNAKNKIADSLRDIKKRLSQRLPISAAQFTSLQNNIALLGGAEIKGSTEWLKKLYEANKGREAFKRAKVIPPGITPINAACVSSKL